MIVVFISAVGIGGLFWWREATRFKAHVQYAKLPGVTLAYYTRGKGEPLLLLEGFGMTMQDWDPALIENLAQNHQVIIFDYRGVGLSTGDTQHLSVEQMAEDSIGLLDQLQIQHTALLGWSMGSLIAEEITLKQPKLVTKLILASTVLASSSASSTPSQQDEYIQNNLGGSWETIYVPLMFPQDKAGKHDQAGYLKRVMTAIQSGEAPKSGEEAAQTKIAQEQALGKSTINTADLADIHTPTLVIAGENDHLTSTKDNKQVAQAIPKARFIIFPDSGHAFLFEDAKAVFITLEKFLQ